MAPANQPSDADGTDAEEVRKPSFLVAGAGAVGSALGGMLRLAGHEVALLGRNRAHMEAVRAAGLRLTGIWGEHVATGFRVVEDAGDLAGPDAIDYVMVTTKSFDTEALLDRIAPVLPGAQFVSVQNGLGNIEAIRARVGPERTIGGMIIIGFSIPAPGRVAVTVYGGEVILGRPDAERSRPADAAVSRLAEVFTRAGVPARTTDNVAAAVWGKVLYNCALNALGAVLDAPYGELAAAPTWDAIGDLVREAFAVARAEGVRLPWESAEGYIDLLAARQLPDTAAHRASMLQDIKRGRRTEIEHMNGAIARLGAARGVPTPVNSAVAALVRFLEARARKGAGA